ncbi:MAG: Spore germination protein B1 [Firmicutes bacterium ADurb.Bin419]|nr:MAG: Spore germination protein B1 [Firmicutes bacterium ADurb.Bin419]
MGYFIGTLAAVVLGQAAVTAGYVSASVIIVIAVTAISSFAISSTTIIYPARLINYLLILFSGTFGMFGFINGLTLIIWHLVSLRSFGMPYLYPLVPFDLQAMKDTFIRSPLKNSGKQSTILLRKNINKNQ